MTKTTKMIPLRVPAAMHKAIKLAATDAGGSMNDWIVAAVERKLARSRFADWEVGSSGPNIEITKDLAGIAAKRSQNGGTTT